MLKIKRLALFVCLVPGVIFRAVWSAVMLSSVEELTSNTAWWEVDSRLKQRVSLIVHNVLMHSHQSSRRCEWLDLHDCSRAMKLYCNKPNWNNMQELVLRRIRFLILIDNNISLLCNRFVSFSQPNVSVCVCGCLCVSVCLCVSHWWRG